VLHRAVRELRRVFGDRTASPRYIETIRKRGYRLMVPAVRPAAEAEARAVDVPGDRDSTTGPWPTPTPSSLSPASRAWPVTLVAAFLTGISVAGVISVASRDEGVTEAHPRFVSIVSGPANESDPALAPDGRRIAYVIRDTAGEQADIYVQDSADHMPRRLTDNPADDRMPAWSPDGRRLAFIRLEGSECFVMLRMLETPDEQNLERCGNADEPRVAWLDAHTIILSDRSAGLGSGRLIRRSLTTGTRTPLSDPPAGISGDHSPAVAPDGRTVAFIRSSGGASDLHIVPATGGASRRVTFDEADITGVTWASGGRALVYSSDRAGGYSLWRVPVEGGTPELMAGGAARLKHPVSAPGRDRLAYESWHYEINVWQVPLVGSAGQARQTGVARAVIRTSELWNLYPQVSPDGASIAYVSTQSGSHELWVADAAGSARRQLTDFGRETRAAARGTAVRAARWARDSRRLVFTAQRGGQVDVYTIDVRSGALRAMTSDEAIEVAPVWSADGRAVLFGRRDETGWNVWARAADTGTPTLVVAGAVAAQVSDEDAIYYTRADRDGVWQWRGPARDPVLVTADVRAGESANWQVTRDGVYFAASEDRTVVLRRVPTTGGAPVRIAELPQYSWPGFSLAADGSQVFYAKWDRRESNIMAMDR
jgi:Tol biopolymer transport system component